MDARKEQVAQWFGLTITEWQAVIDFRGECEASDTVRFLQEISALRSKVSFYESRIAELSTFMTNKVTI